MAEKESLEDLSKGIAISFLPKTFRDAINITKRLGVDKHVRCQRQKCQCVLCS
jgi:hypothetical protein